MSNSIKVGLTGNYLSGLDYVVSIFKRYKIPVFDCDIMIKYLLYNSEEHIEKIRLSKVGKTMSEEAKNKISLGNLGKKKPPRTPEHSEKIAASIKGTKNSEETKRKKSESAKLAWIKRKQK